MNTLCVMCALNTTGSRRVPLSHALPWSTPSQKRYDSTSVTSIDARNAAMPRSRHSGSRMQVDQRGDEQKPQRPDQRIQHVLRGSDRIQRSRDEQREQGERHPARPDCRESPRACRDTRRPRARRRASPRGGCCRAPPRPGSSMPSSTAAHWRTSSARFRAARDPGDRRGTVVAGGTFQKTAVEHRGAGRKG